MEIPYAPENKENSVPDDDYLQFGPPHEAMFFVLAYLPLLELLAMSQVCRSVRDALSNDILPWINITVYKPLSQRLSDDILMKFASKANGKLTTLALINCEKITDEGLQRVISKNPLINKLYFPACTSLTPEGIIRAVEALTKHNHQILHSIRLKINGIHNMKKDQLETLRSLIGLKQTQQQQEKRRNLYHKHNTFSTSTFGHEEDKCSIDVDICPKCNEVRMVFDCPMDRCERQRQNLRRECRGCCFCIPRCEECGQCIESDDWEEAACTDNLCSGCWLQLPKCNFCNRPYCNQHANQKCSVPGSSGFFSEASVLHVAGVWQTRIISGHLQFRCYY
ncbi:unnamed protein product [Ilex paraguariensis]|uniref:F-box domain-containing protein n=1 Tax=Ilex paraguariensis TaxID=185542 RepID=A0ABC8TXH1_9AQUA